MESGDQRLRGLGAGFGQRRVRMPPSRLAVADKEQLRHRGQKNGIIAD
jgi:hypothetical protein